MWFFTITRGSGLPRWYHGANGAPRSTGAWLLATGPPIRNTMLSIESRQSTNIQTSLLLMGLAHRTALNLRSMSFHQPQDHFVHASHRNQLSFVTVIQPTRTSDLSTFLYSSVLLLRYGTIELGELSISEVLASGILGYS